MDAMKRVMIEALELLKSADFKRFTWQLENRVTEGIDRIPGEKLETADRLDVADLMGQYYTTDAGNIAVKALRNINQNELAEQLKRKLQEVPEDVPAGGGASSGGTAGTAQAAGVSMNINTASGGNVKAPVLHGGVFHGPVNFS